ncbi:hypothetical protein [Streptomyces gobiensis]|uniref:hypothetical protein n=1 Tax=Streptomyces gobiensis TaxID=2875706 RepID=UPI001E366240|nr:hypothetical protein [Streptomyces gobiensis]UGY90859.1 hypothetical protein test1122_03385 [Streptomyces gobiensis]
MGITGTGIRATRAAVFTAVCVTLSAGAHVLLSAAPVPLVPLLAVSGAIFVLAFALAGRERRFWHIAALLVPLELAADTIFTTGQQACYGTAGGPVTGPLRSMGFNLICAGGDFGTPLARMASGTPAPPLTHPGAPWLLLAAHIAVGLAAAAWLRDGEASLARLLRAAAAAGFRPLLLAITALCPTPLPRPVAERAGHRPYTPRALPQLTHSVVRRGPPCPAIPAI